MNRYLFLHRIKGPVMLVVFGITALLNQWGILSYGRSWPLYLIAFGVLQLAERAAWSQAYPEQNPGPQPGNWGGPSGPPPPSSTAMTVAPPDEGGR
jgi:hypothetical protein